MVELTSDDVWNAIRSVNFMVIGMVSAQGRGAHRRRHAPRGRRPALVHDATTASGRRATSPANPVVSVTVPIAKRVPFMPWVKVPAATITFSGDAEIDSAPADLPARC